jgi:hypothetical protein
MKHLKRFNENFSNDELITESIIGKLFDRLGYTNEVLKTSIKQTLNVDDDSSKEEVIRKTKELFGESDNKRKLFKIAKGLGVLGEIVTALVVVFNVPWDNWTWFGTFIYLLLSHDENNIIRKPWKDIRSGQFFKDDDKKVNESYSAYNDVWVVIKQGDTDIDKIYLDKSEAENDLIKRQEELKSFTSLKNLKYVVVSLDDAISMIIDAVKDQDSFDRYNSEK